MFHCVSRKILPPPRQELLVSTAPDSPLCLAILFGAMRIMMPLVVWLYATLVPKKDNRVQFPAQVYPTETLLLLVFSKRNPDVGRVKLTQQVCRGVAIPSLEVLLPLENLPEEVPLLSIRQKLQLAFTVPEPKLMRVF